MAYYHPHSLVYTPYTSYTPYLLYPLYLRQCNTEAMGGKTAINTAEIEDRANETSGTRGLRECCLLERRDGFPSSQPPNRDLPLNRG